MDIPDVLGTLLGVRQWAWREEEERLYSIRSVTPDMRRPLVPYPASPIAWEPEEPVMRAYHHYLSAHPPEHPPERAPRAYCVCGLYAFYGLAGVDKDTLGNGVFGIVEAWGNIEEHAQGFRSEFMRAVAIIKQGQHSEVAARVYSLPLVPLREVDKWMREAEGAFIEEGEKKWRGLDVGSGGDAGSP